MPADADVDPDAAVADGPGDLTPAWLSQALKAEVSAVAVERIGTGQTGATYRLSLCGDGLPPTLIAKLAAGDEDARRRVRNGYRREVGFYDALAATVAVRTPRCWYAAITDDGLAFTLLLDDLAPRVPGVQAEGCSPARAVDAVRNLAGLHAPRWNDPALFDLPFLPPRSDEAAEFLGATAVAATEDFVGRFAGELDPGDVATLRAAAAAVTAWEQAWTEPYAVLHGDYRLDNLLFPVGGNPAASDGGTDGGGDGEDNGVVAVDWQTLAVGPPARDLAYFLGTSLRVEDRRAAERDLVAAYVEALAAHGVTGYDAARCFDDYRIGQLQGPMIATIGCAYATGARSPESDAMFLAMVRRSCAAVRDLGTLDAVGS